MIEYDNILSKYFSGNANENEVLQVQEKLASSEDFRTQYESYSQIWELTKQLNHEDSRLDSSWQKFKAIVKAPEKVFGFDWLKLAASILILAAFSVGIYLMVPKDHTYTADTNQADLELKDHTIISLSEGSELFEFKSYGKEERRLRLDGEALFTVKKGDVPFIVETSLGEVKVTGTIFNLFHLDGTDFLALDLIEGSVEFRDKNGDLSTLTAGQRLEWDGNSSNILALENAVLWVDSDEIRCQSVPLKQILLELKKHYELDYRIPKKYLKDRYTISLPKQDIQSCLSLLSKVSGLELALQENGIIVSQ